MDLLRMLINDSFFFCSLHYEHMFNVIKLLAGGINLIIGSKYTGSNNIQVSTTNQEIVPTPPSNWTTRYQFYKFAFMNDQECHVLINNSTEQVYLRAGQGFETDSLDAPIYSFVIVESGITFNWLAAY